MKVVMTIAGSDSSGGAGIQADLKTFEAFGVFGTSAITVLTAQNTTGVHSITPLNPDFVLSQIDSILNDFEVSGIKIGMLYNKEIIQSVEKKLLSLTIPIILDPVCISKAGSRLLEEDAISALRQFSHNVSLVTPNLYEAQHLFGYRIGDSESLKSVIQHSCPILIKNHIMGNVSVDLLFKDQQKYVFTDELITTNSMHGTGCSYASAITANLALGYGLNESIERSKHFITKAIRYAPNIGHGSGPINHQAGIFHEA